MEKDIGKIKKNDETDIIIRIDDFGGNLGLTIREFVTSEKYTGFTKAGVRIRADKLKDFKKIIESIKLEDLSVPESNKEPEKTNSEESGIDEDGTI